MITIKNRIYKILLVILFITFFIISHATIFDIYTTEIANIKLSVFLVLSGSFIYFLFLSLIYKATNKTNEKRCNIIVLLITFISFIILLLWGINHRILPTYDLTHIIDIVNNLLNSNNHTIGYNEYLSMYPHQIPLVIFVYFVELIGTIIKITPDTFMIIYNCFMISLTFLFVYKTLCKLFNFKVAFIGFLLMILTPDFYLYASYYYTDILSIPFAVIGFYSIIKADKMETGKLRYVYYILGGVFFAIGTKLRVVTSFLLIAYIIDSVLKKNLKNTIKKLYPSFLSFIALIMCYSFLIEPSFKIKLDSHYTLPPTHWVMMGTNVDNDGSFLKDDVLNSIDAKDKVGYNLSIIKKRIKKVDLKFYYNKIRRVWTQGDYGILTHYKMVDNYDAFYNLLYGNGNVLIRYLQQITKVVVYVLFLFSIGGQLVEEKNIKNSKVSVIIISIFMALLFYLIWEAQVRYSFSFLPWIIISAASAIYIGESLVDIKVLSINRRKYNFEKVRNITFLCVSIFIILSLLFGFRDYVLTKDKRDIARLVQSVGSPQTSIAIRTSKFKQVFRVNGNFNKISILFDGKELKDDVDYFFELYDNEDKLLYKKEFSAKWALSQKYTKFYPKVDVDKSGEYYFIIYSKEARSDNYLSLWAGTTDSCKDANTVNLGYDINPNGESYYDNEILCYNLRIYVYDQKKTSMVNIEIYLLYSVGILLIIVFIFFKLFKIKHNREGKAND